MKRNHKQIDLRGISAKPRCSTSHKTVNVKDYAPAEKHNAPRVRNKVFLQGAYSAQAGIVIRIGVIDTKDAGSANAKMTAHAFDQQPITVEILTTSGRELTVTLPGQRREPPKDKSSQRCVAEARE